MLELNNIDFSYDREKILDNFSLKLPSDKIIGLLGRSGSGKSTILRIIVGLEKQRKGTVVLDGQVIDDIPTHKRNIGYIFQSLALFPHLKVRDNILFGIKGEPKEIQEKRLEDVSKMLKIDDLLKRYPHELSGGQQQRVAIGRTLITEPRLILFDEPFSALDKELRIELRIEILKILKDKGIPAIVVTHDNEDVDAICDETIIIE